MRAPVCYKATLRDRMFLVSNGVPYDVASGMPSAEVLRLAEIFESFGRSGWQPPGRRVRGSRSDVRAATKEASDGLVDLPLEKAFVGIVAETLQDATFCEVAVDLLELDGELCFRARVKYPEQPIYAFIKPSRAHIGD